MKSGTPANIITCPSCGAENIEGTDECVVCQSDLRNRDVPETAQQRPQHIFLTPLTQFVHWDVPTFEGEVTAEKLLAAARQHVPVIVVRGPDEAAVVRAVESSSSHTASEAKHQLYHAMAAMLKESDNVAAALYRMSSDGVAFAALRADDGRLGYLSAMELLAWLRDSGPADTFFSDTIELLDLATAKGDGPDATTDGAIALTTTAGEAIDLLGAAPSGSVSVRGNADRQFITATGMVVAYAEAHAEMALNLSPDPSQPIPREEGG